MKKTPQSNRDILTLTETESRLSLGMTSNKTYHFQTTANHHRFIKVWTSIADLPTSYTYVQISVVFFYDLSPNTIRQNENDTDTTGYGANDSNSAGHSENNTVTTGYGAYNTNTIGHGANNTFTRGQGASNNLTTGHRVKNTVTTRRGLNDTDIVRTKYTNTT